MSVEILLPDYIKLITKYKGISLTNLITVSVILTVRMFARYRALRTPSNILLVNLCVAGLIMLSPLPLFYVNLYQRGPHLGIIGAKVKII